MPSSVLETLSDGVYGERDAAHRLQAVLVLVVLGVGLASCVRLASKILRFVYRQFLRPAKDLTTYGKWAVVTGATDGIGREYCNALAKQGLNIYLVSRTEAKLTAAAEDIKAAFRVETKIFVADLVAAGALADSGAAWFGLKSNLDGLDVGVLVNNAGMSYEHPEFLHNVDAKALNDIVAINAVALTQMVHVVLPGMKERGRGCVVNISSGVSAALPACPLLAVYAASKAYVDALTAALAAEYSHFGIRFQSQAPAFVATKMAKMRRTSLMVPSPATWVAAAMTHVGCEPRAFPYPVHALLSGSLMNAPEPLAIGYWFKLMTSMRLRALKKKASAAKAQ